MAQGRPACTCPPNAHDSPRQRGGPRARGAGGGGGCRLHRRVVRARRGRHPRRGRGGRRPGAVGRQDRNHRGAPNLGEIIDEAGTIMVARGDLGIDCPLEDLPHLQKTIIRRCVEFGVPVITATQMLESMVTAPLPLPRSPMSPTRSSTARRADAVGRDGDRPRPGARRGDDGSHRRPPPSARLITATGRPASAASCVSVGTP